MNKVMQFGVTAGGVDFPLAETLTPSAVTPGIELIRNAERSLNGSMTVDVVGQKKNYELSWSLLSNDDFVSVCNYFPPSSVVQFYETSHDADGSEKRSSMYCIVDDLSYQPVVYESLMWQNVVVKLAER